MFWKHLQPPSCFMGRMFADESRMCDHMCALERDKTKVAKSFPVALLPLQEPSPGHPQRPPLPLQRAGQRATMPTNIMASPAPSPMLLALSTSSPLPLCAWSPPGLPQPCSAPAPEQAPHHSVCDISFSTITFPISELNSHPVLLFQKGTFSSTRVGISRIWDCEKHIGRRQNTWVAFESDFIELVLLALHICVHTHTFCYPHI